MNSLRVLHLSRAARIAAVLLISSLSAAENPPAPSAANPDLRTLLRDALFEEEATRDLNKAAAGYEALLTKWSEQRALAAAALFRLAEVRRKQDRKDDAIKLYQRLITEFAEQDPHARLSRENLAALGVKEPSPSAPAPAVSDEEATTLARVQKLAVESPDLLTDLEFTIACRKGWLSVVKFLISKEVSDEWGQGLQAAAAEGHLAIVRELLPLKPFPDYMTSAVPAAVESNRLAVLKLLLESGASPDSPDGGAEQFPALWIALDKGHTEAAELLLAHKASADPAGAATAPLFAASRTGNAPMVQRLLSLKADPNRATRPLRTPENSNPPKDLLIEPNGSTPLHAAVASGSAECVNLLLAANANINATNDAGWTPLHGAAREGNAALIERLIVAGAAPDGGAPVAGKERRSPLWFAIGSGKTEAVAALLKGKADPNILHDGYVPAAIAVEIKDEKTRDEILVLLLEHGADPTAGKPSAIQIAPTALKVKLLRSHQYPKLTAKPEITLVFADEAREAVIEQRGAADDKPASLPSLLLVWHDRGGWKSKLASQPDWSTVRLFRKGDGSKMAETVLPIKAGAEFPALQWGDVIEVTSAASSQPDGESQQGRRVLLPGDGAGLPPETLTILRGTQSVRITFKTGDFSKNLTLRGGLRTYDLNSGEAPLQSVDRTVTLLAGSGPGMVKIERSAARGGGTVEWPAGGGSGHALPEDGDIITFTPDKPDAKNLRVSLRVTGQPGVWRSYGPVQSVSLLQFLSEFYRALSPQPLALIPDLDADPALMIEKIKARTPEELLANLIASGENPSGWPYLPWPDWSGVMVRRWIKSDEQEAGPSKGGKVIFRPAYKLGEPELFDLLAAMKSLTPESTPDDARKFDTLLNPGDEVELPLLKDHPAGPWPGPDEAALRLFTKALIAKVTVSDPDGRFHQATLQWLPPRWVPTPAGVLPIPDGVATGGRVHWIRALPFVKSVATGMEVNSVSRQNGFVVDPKQEKSDDVFLRPGDRIMLRPVSRHPAPVAIPRPGTSNVPNPNIPKRQISPGVPQPGIPGLQ